VVARILDFWWGQTSVNTDALVKLPIPTLQRGFTFPTQYLSNERGKNSPLNGPGAPPPRSPGIHRVPGLTGFLSGKTLTLRLFTPNRCSNRVYPWEPLTARMECFLTLMQVGWPFGVIFRKPPVYWPATSSEAQYYWSGSNLYASVSHSSPPLQMAVLVANK
jgi:hypothetical protein